MKKNIQKNILTIALAAILSVGLVWAGDLRQEAAW